MLERHGVAIDPSPLGGRLHHGVLPAHVVGGEGHINPGGHLGDHVEIRQSRLHHHDVGSFGHVERHLAQGFASVPEVLLVGLAVPSPGDAHVDRLTERSVESRGVLGRIGEHRHLAVAVLVERGADGADLAVHHPARGDHVGPGLGLGQSHLLVQLDGGVVVDTPVGPDDPAVAVVGVLVETEIGDQHQLVAHGVA